MPKSPRRRWKARRRGRCVGQRLVEENEKSWHPVGVHLGYIYDPSPIVVPDGSAKLVDDTIGYRPTAFPGARAPHVWLAPEKSIRDFFGVGFTLLAFADLPTAVLEQAAAERVVPLAVRRIGDLRKNCRNQWLQLPL